LPETIAVKVDGASIDVPVGCTIAAAIFIAGGAEFRTSVRGERRGPLCGMGICFECRVTVDGTPHTRSCQVYCRAGMEIKTG
jgi:predicted molibdopterin-dependent oxidoreductase YjgC